MSKGSSPLHTAAKSPVVLPDPAYDGQDLVFSDAFDLLQHGVAERAFPAASLAVTHGGRLVALKSFGRFTYEPDSPEVVPTSIFDLASVSKIVATTSVAMILYERGLLDLDAPVVAVVPEFAAADSRRAEVTVRMLLAHSSGLPAYEKLFLRAKSRADLLAAAFTTPLTADPGTRSEYSDIGFITLGAALERIADEPLDRFCQREIFGPLGMGHTTFNPPAGWRASLVPTSDDRTSRRRVIQGEVQDENASVLSGVAGNAGVFSTAEDVAIFAHAMLNGGGPILRSETLAQFTRRESSPPGTFRALGWDTPSVPSQSGRYFSSRSFGHLGYTGTSLWIDPERQLSVSFLTNRTWPDCKNEAIKEVRPRVHDAIIEALETSAA
ncbi:MAG TPA: serine hydrolase domain-containing protein [Terriglobales bacterium]|nr:serine hydrolase domain-containing protein [Terriglobales bacterium]